MSSSPDLIKLIVTCLGVGGGLLYSAIRAHRRHRNIADTPRSKVATAPQGFIELQGFAWPSGPTLPTESGGEALYHSLTVQQQKSTGTGKSRRKTWVTVFQRVHAEPFYLVDATGLALIDPSQAEVNVEGGRKRLWYSLPQTEKNRLLNHVIKDSIPGFPPSTILFGLFGGRFRVIENQILVGSPIYASGDYRGGEGFPHKIQATGLETFARKTLDREKRGLRKLDRILDTNGDGKVCIQEARDGYTTAARINQKKKSAPSPQDELHDLFGTLGSSESHKLFLADAFENHLASRLQRGIWPKFAGGAALVAFGILTGIQSFVPRPSTSPPSRQPSSVVLPAPQALHRNCVNGEVGSCETLLHHRIEYRLTTEQIQYYSRQAQGSSQK